MATGIQAPALLRRGTQMPSTVKDLLLDDIVPSLPPDWQPSAFSTWEVQSSHSDARDLNEEVSLL